MSAAADVLVEVKNLRKYFPIRGGLLSRLTGHVKAVDSVSFAIRRGETLGLVGESGCGKTTLGRALMMLEPPTSGDVVFAGQHLSSLSSHALQQVRREMQMVFQDPYGSLNPRMSVGNIIAEPLEIHGVGSKADRKTKISELLEVVGLAPYHINRYPHEFSGGQRQRIGIARALALRPQLMVCDEPVSALDVSIQSQIINLLSDLQSEFGLTYLFIAHNLSVVYQMSDRIGVMYLGKIVEMADGDELFSDPLHPYTEALLSAIPVAKPGLERGGRILLEGDLPSPIDPPAGCRFRTRCWLAHARCSEVEPLWTEAKPNHWVACHLR